MTACRFFCEIKPQKTAKRFQRGLPLLFYEFCSQHFPTISVDFSIYQKKGTPEYMRAKVCTKGLIRKERFLNSTCHL